VTYKEIAEIEGADDDASDKNNFADLGSLFKKGWKLTGDLACKGAGCQQMCMTAFKHEDTKKACRCKPGYTTDPNDPTEATCIPVPVCEKFCLQEFKKAKNNVEAAVKCTDSCNAARHSVGSVISCVYVLSLVTHVRAPRSRQYAHTKLTNHNANFLYNTFFSFLTA
jgi:hypothetical protein